ncbi:hypothetical protein D3C71_1109680 [compost metagenome]
MGIVENIKFLCSQHGVTIPKLGVELGFGNGAIYNWDKSSPSIDKVIKIADYFGATIDFVIFGFDKEITQIVKDLSEVKNGKPHFPNDVMNLLKIGFEPLQREYYDVPLDADPLELIALIRDCPLTTAFKKDLLKVLIDVKTSVNNVRTNEPVAVSSQYEENWTEKELEELEQFKEFLRMKRG